MPDNRADVTDRETDTDGGGASRAPHNRGDSAIGARAMRSALASGLVALGLLVMPCASADAATVHHVRKRQPVTVSPAQEVIPPGWYKFPGYPPIPPEQNRNLDPSTRGSG